MSVSTFTIANLEVREALLCLYNYQQNLLEVSVFEWKDIRRRYPNLIQEHMMLPEQREEFRKSLFWGSSTVSMKDDARETGWLVALAETFPGAIGALEAAPEVEAAFEMLYAVDCLQQVTNECQGRVSEWKERIMAVLLRLEFSLTRDLIEERLRDLMGAERLRRPYHGR
jgi:hypothetical protein